MEIHQRIHRGISWKKLKCLNGSVGSQRTNPEQSVLVALTTACRLKKLLLRIVKPRRTLLVVLVVSSMFHARKRILIRVVVVRVRMIVIIFVLPLRGKHGFCPVVKIVHSIILTSKRITILANVYYGSVDLLNQKRSAH